MKEDVLAELWQIINERKAADPKESWTAKLFEKGPNYISKKVGEEACEVIIAAISGKKKHLVAESADLLYHLLVLWAERNVQPQQVYEELEERFNISGIKEKASRREA